MTVKELCEALAKFDPDANVYGVPFYAYEITKIEDVGSKTVVLRMRLPYKIVKDATS